MPLGANLDSRSRRLRAAIAAVTCCTTTAATWPAGRSVTAAGLPRAAARAGRPGGVAAGGRAGYGGYVAKDEASAYEGGPTRRWLKVKVPGRTDAGTVAAAEDGTVTRSGVVRCFRLCADRRSGGYRRL